MIDRGIQFYSRFEIHSNLFVNARAHLSPRRQQPFTSSSWQTIGWTQTGFVGFFAGEEGRGGWSSALLDINRASTQLIPFDGPIFARIFHTRLKSSQENSSPSIFWLIFNSFFSFSVLRRIVVETLIVYYCFSFREYSVECWGFQPPRKKASDFPFAYDFHSLLTKYAAIFATFKIAFFFFFNQKYRRTVSSIFDTNECNSLFYCSTFILPIKRNEID